ncbi:MAG: hypothetical protein C4326_09005 [Ignavibacteria bacterium]
MCVTEVFHLFDTSILHEVRKPLPDREVFICVAVKELEAWFLADDQAINRVLPKAAYKAPQDTGTLNAQRELGQIWRRQYMSSFNKIAFAIEMAKSFSPQRAERHSPSFAYCWQKMGYWFSGP